MAKHRRSRYGQQYSISATVVLGILTFFSTTYAVSGPGSAAAPRPPPPKCLVFLAENYGLGSHFNNIASGAAMSGLPDEYYIDDTDFNYQCNGTTTSSPWASLFAAPYPKLWRGPHMPFQSLLRKNHGLPFSEPEGRNCTVINYAYTHDVMEVLSDVDVAFKRLGQAVLKMWVFETETQKYVESHLSMLRSLPRPLVAIHVRGGDKASEQRKFGWHAVLPSNYSDAVRKFTPSVVGKGGTCIFIGDDFKPLAEVALSVANVVVCTTILQAPPQYGTGGHDQEMFNQIANKCDMSRLLLAQIETMAIADYFVGAYTSNVARLVQLLRVHKYKKSPASGMDVLSRPWVPTPFAHKAYTLANVSVANG